MSEKVEISKKLKTYEVVVPMFGRYNVIMREADEKIRKNGSVYVDPGAVLEFTITREEALKLRSIIDSFLAGSADKLLYHISDPERRTKQ